MNFQRELKKYDSQPITQQTLMHLLREYEWPYNKIGQLVKSGMLEQVKRGLYVAGKESDLNKPSNFLLANHIYGPSYVSLESALSYRGLIPEKVSETMSVTIGASRSFDTTIGRFTYRNAETPYYSYGIRQVTVSENQVVLMASSEKALCDKIIMTPGIRLRSITQTREFLEEDLRIDLSSLQQLDTSIINDWIAQSQKQDSLTMLVKTLNGL
ncbi:MAG: hypothetical protein EOO02_06650 [Chitinophagaceae bacterium]|nr:MAG: hypothetical protein EOO02_06650 [Chitinophagaceae bacterium]